MCRFTERNVYRLLVLLCLGVSGGLVTVTAQADIALTDPTRPLNYGATAVAQKNALVLNSILHSAGRKQAVINGQTVREQDVIAGALVQRINADSVLMSRDGKPLTLTLRSQIVKTRNN